MMQKNKTRVGAAEGSFTPFTVGPDEIVLTGITLEGIADGDRVVLDIDVTWLKPMCDLGELELILRRDAPTGTVIYWTMETCFARARVREECIVRGEGGMRHFFLTTRSSEHKAMLAAYYLEGTVYAGT
ncbi:hypothetical protein RJP21_24010 [Paenibacillus sp. VCA1]|uniref:hypothetical protein n=1 Tax=Paenibacillus sp. VCA1 TaxID=3039148 RepID=UPI0028725AD5|nr:hypothetical protein [Paenibacillus sp. VCA1]MDR9856671.1 hypothetical protein [Paenibacillus sp. VCA1]